MSNKIKFIINTSVDYFAISQPNTDDLPIREFLENDDITILSALNHGNKIVFLHNVPTDENCVIFYKIPQIGGNQQTADAPLGMLTLEGGLTKSIYNSVTRIFSPHVTKKIEYTPELESLIENLQTTLGTSLGLPKSTIHSVQQEINYWNDKSLNSATKSDKEAAKTFLVALEKLNELLRDAGSISSLDEFLDSIHTTLEELWRLPNNYPQNRMVDLIDIISGNVLEFCADHLSIEDVWNLKSFEVSQTLRDILEIVESWIQVCDSLTRLFWPNYGQHPWLGEPHIPRNALLFQERLNEIKNIKNMYKDITCLFNENNHIDKSIRRIFIPFREINIFDITPVGTKKWKKALLQYEHVLEPINEKISLVLKSKLHNHLNDPREVIQIFVKYGTVLKRPDIMEQLSAEREHFLESLHSLMKEFKSYLNENHTAPDDLEISPICWETKGLKQFQNELIEISNVSYLIKDMNGYDSVEKLLNSLNDETERWLQASFETWRQQSLASVSTGNLTLKDEKPVVEFEKDGRQLMMVTFKPKLVTFCSDVREFEAMGYRVPIELRNTAMHAIKFMGHARKLQQIANFHNTIGDRMIACLRPIMLKNALELSKLVRSESVAWNDEESVDRYVSTLQYSVNNLSSDNTILTEYHEKTKAIIIKLLGTDLLRQGDIWKEEMRNLRNIIAHLETKGYSNLNAFKLHWDHQLYKILEYQYLSGLLDINQKLPNIYIDIVFRQQEVQFRPTMEEIRSTYFAQLRRFIERPITFKGLSSEGNIFKVMVDINRHKFSSLYDKGEQLFNKLCEFRDLWRPFVALGCVNLDELCDVHLKTRDDWDRNFKACKHFSQQIAKISSSESKIDCFVINTSPLRSDIEFISRKYWEVLTYSLRTSILKDVTELQDFLNTSSQVLQAPPLMEDVDLDEAGGQYERLMNELPHMSNLLKSVESKDSCLAGWCRERVTALANIVTQWEQLQPLIDNHSAALRMQAEIVRNQIEFQLANLKDETEKFQIRWESTITDLENNEEINLQLFKERLQNWNTISQQKYKLERSCNKYMVEFPADIQELFVKLADDVSSMGHQWEIFEEFSSEYQNVTNEEWTVYRRRPYILTDFISKWQGNANSQSNKASKKIQQMLEEYQTAIPTLQCLQADGLTERHWANIFHLLQMPYKAYHDITLKDILDNSGGLIEKSADIQQLVRKASSEQIIRQAIAELDQWGASAMLKTATHADSLGEMVYIIKDFQDILNKIGDNQCLLQSAKNSAAFDSYSDQAEIWEGRLASLDHILSSLNQIQRKWIYLEPIFGTEKLIAEGSTFKQINKDFRYIMKEISNDTRVLSLVKIHSITSIIDSLENQLNRCQNTLTSFINAKRNAFPRFYFLSNDDLLEFLGQSTKDHIIQKHIKKLFPGVHELGCESTGKITQVTAVRSAEGEEIILNTPIDVTGPIEKWLNLLLNEIKTTMKDRVARCCQYEQITAEIISKFPAQVLYLAKAIHFTKTTEKAIATASLQRQLKILQDEIEYFTSKFSNTTHLTQIKVRGLLLDLVHYVSIVQQLMNDSVTNVQDWGWMQQIRFYINSSNNLVTIRMVYAEFEYSYEYLGNYNKLVDTKLTHNCYLTLTQAMQLGLGGNPFGPAGTGKTECVKSLGAMLGRLVLVFNCNENVDTTAIGLILAGLARCGAWGCFDEFNRLQEATLSVLSMLIQPIQSALQSKSTSVDILNDTIPLNLHCGIFVTLNPAGEEYGGRQTLPANLQALFRPIVMQQPEPKEIARVMLFVEGFKHADVIGARMVELFSMAKGILSPQRHYEWGLRELKTILIACGRLLKDNGPLSDSTQEMEISVRALRSNTMSKLNASDCERFDMLIDYVFANTKIDFVRNDVLRIAIQQAFATLNLQLNDRQLEKCLQLHEQLEKRMGVVILGPPGCGKSTIIAVLKQALLDSSHTVKSYTIAPKSMDRIQLLGRLDPDTRQWQDGVLTTTAVTVNNEPLDVNSWIICDGDVDPDWIEALNSVLDDNKLLTLPSGWRIQFGNNVNFIFETHDLGYASPATISRMGIVTFSAEDLPDSVLVDTWIQSSENAEKITAFASQYISQALSWVHSKQKTAPTSGVINNVLNNSVGSTTKDEFAVRLVYGVGFALSSELHSEFANKVFEWADVYIPNGEEPRFCFYNKYRDAVEIFKSDDMDHTSSNEFKIDRLICTAKMKTYSNVLNILLEHNVPFVIIGPSGSGKSLLLQTVVGEMGAHELVTISCSAQLTAKYVLYILKQNSLVISGNRGREYRPKFSYTVFYFKNIDLCPVDEWGTSEVVELILQLIERKGFYADTLEWISVTGLKICSSMSDIPKQTLSPRFLQLVQNINTEYPSDDELHLIVKNQLSNVFNRFKKHLGKVYIDQIAESLIQMYIQTKKEFTRDIMNHYIFTPKMLTNLIGGLTFYPEDRFQQALYVESCNIFRNRLIDSRQKRRFDEIWDGIFNHIFDIDKSNYFLVPTGNLNSHLKYVLEQEWVDVIQRSVTICNTEDVHLQAVIGPELFQMSASICRALCRPKTHLILLGMAGCGMMESLHISCNVLNIKMLSVTPVKNYAMEDFYSDIKIAMQAAALEEQHIVFYIEHAWISYLADVLNPIEAILEGSEISDLFGDDLETIAKPLKNAAQQDGYQESLVAYFWSQVQTKLHIVISFESESKTIEDLFTKYPALYRSSEMMWISNQNDIISEKGSDEILKVLSQNKTTAIPVPKYMLSIHLDQSAWTRSPYRFKNLICSYYYIFNEMVSKIKSQQTILQAGVDKLSAAQQVVQTLKVEAEKQEVALADKRQLANNALELITSTMRNANDQKTDLLDLKKKTQESSVLLKERQAAVALELREVEPLLQEAVAAVGQIKSEALSEIRSLRAPPDIIRDILEGVLRLMGTRDTSWNSMKSFLAKRGVKEDIRSLNPARISPESCAAVEKLLQSKAESFEMKNAKRASAAAAPLSAWVIANVKYCKVIQSVKPLEEEQTMLQQNLIESENNMKMLMSGLSDVDAKVKSLSEQLNVYTQEAAVLEIKLQDARNTLQSSEVLVSKLSTEYENWKNQLEDINCDIDKMDINAFCISYYISHLSYMTYDDRTFVMQQIAEELNLANFDISKKLLTDEDRIIWENMGLTSDIQSMENAAILTKILSLPFGSTPIPLLNDPTKGAISWLPNYLKSLDIPYEITTQNAERFTYTLELAVRFGKVLIVNDCNKIRPPLLHILQCTIHSRFNKKLLQVGNKLVDYNENFKLILCSVSITELQEAIDVIGAYITIIPFTTTVAGLTDQLMMKSILVKQPELETKRVGLLQAESKMCKDRQELQNKLLYELSSSQGDILKNEKLLQTLNEVKASSTQIDSSLRESAEVKRQLMLEYEQFKDICYRAAKLFIGITQNYNLSVTVFTMLYEKSIKANEEFNSKMTYEHLVRLTYNMLSRSIPKSDHITLGLQIYRRAYPELVPDKEWESFITNFMSGDEAANQHIPPWIPKSAIPKLLSLQSNHPEFYQQLNLDNENLWSSFINDPQPNDVPVKISEFRKILVTQVFRSDLLTTMLTRSLTKTLGTSIPLETKPSIQQLLDESKEDEPIVFITSGEIDPSRDIQDYARSKYGKQNYIDVAIGKGQEQAVTQQIQNAAEHGHWICVKNVQMVTEWLHSINDTLQQTNISNGFRLWLICDSSKHFPPSLLAKCKTVLYEPPNSIKSKVLRLIQQWNPMIEKKKEAKLVKLFIALFMFNAVLQERRTYIPEGWSTWYEFSDSDLKAAIDIIGWMEKSVTVKMEWAILRKLFNSIAYGGRISNPLDLQILNTNLDLFFNNKLLTNSWSPLQFNVNIPSSSNVQDYCTLFMKFPDIDKPEVFGLSAATILMKDTILCKNILKNLRNSADFFEGQNNFDKRLRPILNLWKKLNQGTYLIQSTDNVEQNVHITDPWTAFLDSEINLAKKLFKSIHQTLVVMNAATKDISSIGKEDISLMKIIAENQVPLKWRQLWSGPRTLIDYLKAVVNRGIEAEKRFNSEKHIEFCENIDLAKVYNVESFFAALKLRNARELEVSTCDLHLTSSVSNATNTSTTTKPTVAPIILNGASWRSNQVVLSIDAKQASFTSDFSLSFSSKPISASGCVKLPLYSNSSRTSHICDLFVQSSATTDDVILSGAALVIPDF